jgi:hypothetical protein
MRLEVPGSVIPPTKGIHYGHGLNKLHMKKRSVLYNV